MKTTLRMKMTWNIKTVPGPSLHNLNCACSFSDPAPCYIFFLFTRLWSQRHGWKSCPSPFETNNPEIGALLFKNIQYTWWRLGTWHGLKVVAKVTCQIIKSLSSFLKKMYIALNVHYAAAGIRRAEWNSKAAAIFYRLYTFIQKFVLTKYMCKVTWRISK